MERERCCFLEHILQLHDFAVVIGGQVMLKRNAPQWQFPGYVQKDIVFVG
jgi:hypothetical protein